jgi:uncharacterized membrane protein YdjX (TVP38/TMEM64 family)
LVLYYLARLLGSDWVNSRFGSQSRVMLERIQRVGSMAIFAITAHPVGLLTPAHLAAGLLDMRVGHFIVAVALASPIRAAPYAMLGTAVLDLSGAQFAVVTVILLLLFVVPLAFPVVREWLWGAGNSSEEAAS